VVVVIYPLDHCLSFLLFDTILTLLYMKPL
jgi:hypothetical protein